MWPYGTDDEKSSLVCEIYYLLRTSPSSLQVMLSVWEGLEDADLVLIEHLDNLSLLGRNGDTLGDELDALLLSLLLGGVVLLDSLDESLVASRLAHVLNSNVEALAELVARLTLVTSTPTADLVTLKTTPVLPW